MPEPVVSDASVIVRKPLMDPMKPDKDAVVVRVRGERLPPSRLSADRVLVVLVRVAGDPQAKWQLGTAYGSPEKLATIDAPLASRDHWEMVVNGPECDADYQGNVEVVAAFMRRSDIDGKEKQRIRERWADAAGVSHDSVRSNVRSAFSEGMTAGQPPSPYRQVAELGANVSIERYISVLGQPAVRHRYGRLVEYSFTNEHFYVYAVADESDTVVLFTITSRTSGFRPRFRYWDGETDRVVQLGVTRFSQIGDFGTIGGFISGATASTRYYEILYFGNPGNYQDHVFAWNDAGWGEVTDAVDIDTFNGAMDSGADQSHQAVATFRRAQVINTFGLSAPMFSVDKFIDRELKGDFTGGVRRVEMRVLPDAHGVSLVESDG